VYLAFLTINFYLKVKIDDECNTNDKLCWILGASCTEGKCKCVTGSATTDKTSCNQGLPKLLELEKIWKIYVLFLSLLVLIGEKCADVNQCLHTKTTCEDEAGSKICKCGNTAVPNTNKQSCLASRCFSNASKSLEFNVYKAVIFALKHT
jgi:hypothetical protein